MVAAALEQALDFSKTLYFLQKSWLGLVPRFAPFLPANFEQFCFNGDVHAMPEGSFFAAYLFAQRHFGRASGARWQITRRIRFGVTRLSHRGLVIYPFELLRYPYHHAWRVNGSISPTPPTRLPNCRPH